MFSLTDDYARNARLKPAFVVVIPISITAAAFGSAISAAIGALVGSASALGLTALVTQLARDPGKRKEPALFARWTGKPSVAKLRYRDTSVNPHTRARYVAKARILMPQLAWPSELEERNDPVAADRTYEAFSNLLLEKTRNVKEFPLVYSELVNYGFRRNLWGLKPAGLVCSICSLAAAASLVGYHVWTHSPVTPTAGAAMLIDAALVLIWWRWINPAWVKLTADAYADRLFAATEHL